MRAFSLGEEVGKQYNTQRKLTPEQLSKANSLYFGWSISSMARDKSDEYKLGLSKGLSLGVDFVTTSGVSGLPHKQGIK